MRFITYVYPENLSCEFQDSIIFLGNLVGLCHHPVWFRTFNINNIRQRITDYGSIPIIRIWPYCSFNPVWKLCINLSKSHISIVVEIVSEVMRSIYKGHLQSYEYSPIWFYKVIKEKDEWWKRQDMGLLCLHSCDNVKHDVKTMYTEWYWLDDCLNVQRHF